VRDGLLELVQPRIRSGIRLGEGVSRRRQSETRSSSPFVEDLDVRAEDNLRFEYHLEWFRFVRPKIKIVAKKSGGAGGKSWQRRTYNDL
jgi:hypothetical protein